MFGNRKDPMIDTVQKVMNENARRRQIEADLNEELGIQDRKQLGHEKHDLYDQALLQRINEAKDVEANEKPPFDPDPPRKKRPDEPKTAKGLAKAAMLDMITKAAKAKPNKQNMEEEQIDEERKRTSVVSSAFLAGKPAKQKELQTNGQEMTYHGNVIAKHAGDEVHVTTAGYGHSPSTRGHINGVLNRLGAPGLSQRKGKLMHGDTEVGTRDWIKIKKPTATMSEEQIDELRKETLGSYIKKASTDVHNKGYQAGNAAPKYGYGDDKFKKPLFKSIKRQVGISKATDKLTKEENIQELSKETVGSYVKKASHDVATKSAATGRYAERANKVKDETKKGDYSNYQQGKKDDATADKMFGKSWKRRKFIAKAVDKLTNEDLSLESIQEEIRNNLLERANHLLEHGSQDQIVEFMNDLTLEQRSILNMQEIFGIGIDKIASGVKGAIAGLKGGSQASNAAALGNKATQAGAELGGNVRRAVEPVAAKVSDAGKAVSDTIKANPVKSVVGAAAAGAAGGAALNNTPTPPAATSAAAKPASTAKSEVGASAQANVPDDRFKPATPASTAKSEVGASAQANVPDDRLKPATPRQAASTSAAAPPPKTDYGSGNASAGFERGKYAAPDASDNSSGANELRSKQQAVDRGNLEESITFERFLRNR